MMSSHVPPTARIFLVGGLPLLHEDGGCTGEAVTFVELPRLPISPRTSANGEGCEARPLVSPMLHLGRHSPLLRTSLHNDRRWSRKLLEITSWCIEGLPSGDALCPIEETALPYAGVRVRLSGRGGPIRVLPRCARDERRGALLTEPGACAWLQHGDTIDFGAGVQLRFLAVHVHTSPARELAQHASFLWVQPSGASLPAAPVAMWSARFTDWSAIPKFLKAKMLTEAAQLVQQAARQEEARWRGSATAATLAPSSEGEKGRPSSDLSPLPMSLHDATGPREGSNSSSEARQDACTEVDAADVEAATPTSQQQQQQRRRPRQSSQLHAYNSADSPQAFYDRGQTRSAPLLVPAVSDARATALAALPASQGQSPTLQRVTGTGPHPYPSGPSARPSLHTARYSCATFSETMDDKLHDALLNLENGGNDVGDTLVQQQQQQHRQPAALLGAMEEDLSGPRASSAGEGLPHRHGGSPQQHQPHQSRRTGKRGGRGRDAGPGERSGSCRSADDGDGYLLSSLASSPRKHRRATSASVSHSQPLRKDSEADGVAAPPLTRADIKRLKVNQAAQEDSQVVFFDH